MIYPISKILNSKSQIPNSRQAGVTLLLAILILSTVLSISFSLATILFIEVRNSSDLLRTEPAFYAASGVGEQALFDLERHSCPANDSTCYTSGFTNNVALSGVPSVISTSSPILGDRVKVGSTFTATLNDYGFCPANGQSTGCNFGKVTVDYIVSNNSSDNLFAYLCQFDPTSPSNYQTAPCTQLDDLAHGLDQGYWLTANSSGQNVDGSYTLNANNLEESWTLDPNLQQELVLTHPTGSADIYVKISTFADQSGTTPKGLPFVGKTAIEVNTVNSSVGRKIQVTVPNSPASSGAANSTNYAAAANGGIANGSQPYNGSFPIADINDGDRLGNNWGNGGAGGGWNDASGPPSWAGVSFNSPKNISEIDVYTLSNNYQTVSSIDGSTPADAYGIQNFNVQYNTGGGWTDVPGSPITNNNLAWTRLRFPTINNVSAIRVNITAAHSTYGRLVELEAY